MFSKNLEISTFQGFKIAKNRPQKRKNRQNPAKADKKRLQTDIKTDKKIKETETYTVFTVVPFGMLS